MRRNDKNENNDEVTTKLFHTKINEYSDLQIDALKNHLKNWQIPENGPDTNIGSVTLLWKTLYKAKKGIEIEKPTGNKSLKELYVDAIEDCVNHIEHPTDKKRLFQKSPEAEATKSNLCDIISMTEKKWLQGLSVSCLESARKHISKVLQKKIDSRNPRKRTMSRDNKRQ